MNVKVYKEILDKLEQIDNKLDKIVEEKDKDDYQPDEIKSEKLSEKCPDCGSNLYDVVEYIDMGMGTYLPFNKYKSCRKCEYIFELND